MESKNIPMEAETIPMLVGGFGVIIVFTLIFIVFMLVRKKDAVYMWFLVQIIFLIAAFKSVLQVLERNVPANSMLSENTSLDIGTAALMWSFSMICMVMGIYRIGRKR